MKYKVFWYAAIPLISAALGWEWAHGGGRSLVSPALVASILIAYVWEFVWNRTEDAKARARESLVLKCKHGNPRLKPCTPCAEEFAYWDTCKLCGFKWDTRHQKHDHTLHVEDASGRPMQQPVVMRHFSSQMTSSFLPQVFTSSYYSSGFPMYSGGYHSSSSPMYSLQRGAECKMTR